MNTKPNPATLPVVGQMVTCTNYYTGRSHSRKVLAVSKTGTKITVERPDWRTGKAEFFYSPSARLWRNDYSGELLVERKA